ncbi:MAG: hypothetical protein ACRC1H_01165, partial [Caldilineaceae bacterium]
WFFGALALVALLTSFGENGPLFGVVYRLLPGFGVFRGQERAAYLVALALSLLAGIGAARLGALPVRTRRRTALVVGALIVAGVYAAGLLMQLLGRTAVSNGLFLLIAIIALLLGVAAALLIWLPLPDDRLPARMIALTLVGLFLANFGLNFDRTSLSAQVTLPPEATALHDAVAAEPELPPSQPDGLPGRVFNEFRVWENFGMTGGVEDLWGASPLRLARYARLLEGFPLDRWWQLSGVTHLLTWRRELFVPSTLLGEWPQASDTTYLHRLSNPGPRAWVVSGVEVAEDDDAWAMLADHSVALTQTAILPPEAAVAPRPPVANALPATLMVERLDAETFDVMVESDGGLLVLSENWMPGWRLVGEEPADVAADADGDEESPENVRLRLVRANLSFLAVVLPPGSQTFTLRYDPQSVRAGLWASGGTLAIAAASALVLVALSRRRQRP